MRSLALILLGSACAWAHTRLSTSVGAYFARSDYENVQFVISESFAPAAKNADGRVIITADSDPVAALKAATKVWSGSEFSEVRFAEPQVGPASNDRNDRRSVFVFADTPEIRSVLGSSLAITLLTGSASGILTDTDILFNPNIVVAPGQPPLQFSTTGEPGTFDILSIAAHELGHALGAGHSGYLGAIMFQAIGLNVSKQLSTDDQAFLREAYPTREAFSQFGRIQGQLTLANGAPARAVLMSAVDRDTGVAVGGLSRSTGFYTIDRVPPGNYVLYAEPADGPVRAINLYLPDNQVDLDFETTFFEGGTVEVVASGTVTADMQLRPLVGGLPVRFVARGAPGGAGDFYETVGALEFSAGETADMMVAWTGLGTVTDAKVELLGAGMTVRPDTLRIDPLLIFPDGGRVLRFTVDVGSPPERSLDSLIVRQGDKVWTGTGLFVVAPGEPITLSGTSVVNAALLAPGPLAPSSWVSVFAPNLARELVVAPPGSLPTTLGGTTVFVLDFRGVLQPARLQFVSPNQLNFLMPANVAGGELLLRIVSAIGGGSIAVRLAAVAPGIFSANSTGQGPAAAAFLKIAAGGERTSGLTFRADAFPRRNAPIDLGSPGDEVYLTFYGTGIRGHVRSVTATIGSAPFPVLAAVAQGEFEGLDQINAGPVPRQLVGGGEAPVVFDVDGRLTNPVTISIR